MSDTVSSSTDYRRKRSKNDKKKKKKEAKDKRNKHKKQKRSRRSHEEHHTERRDSPNIPTISLLEDSPRSNSGESFGPVLPPHLKPKEVGGKKAVVGPLMPSGIMFNNPLINLQNLNSDSDDNDDEMFGPLPVNIALESRTLAQIALEKRALEARLARFEDSAGTSTSRQNAREEWMLELPEVGANKDILGTLKRTFKKKEGPDFSDRSSWTTTPNDAKKAKSTLPQTKTSLKTATQDRCERQRDAEQEKIAKKLHKKQKRDESLLEMHKRKMKEKKEEENQLQRRPFSRDVDLKVDKIDKSQTQQIVNRAKFLDSRFSGGKTKYL